MFSSRRCSKKNNFQTLRIFNSLSIRFPKLFVYIRSSKTWSDYSDLLDKKNNL